MYMYMINLQITMHGRVEKHILIQQIAIYYYTTTYIYNNVKWQLREHESMSFIKMSI